MFRKRDAAQEASIIQQHIAPSEIRMVKYWFYTQQYSRNTDVHRRLDSVAVFIPFQQALYNLRFTVKGEAFDLIY